MVNHVRTLLLNKHASKVAGAPGAEIVDLAFLPLDVPDLFLRIREAVIPAGSSAHQENCLLAYAMRLLHAPELAPFTLRFDRRTTYDLGGDYLAGLRQPYPAVAAYGPAANTVALRYEFMPEARTAEQAGELSWALSHGQSDDAATLTVRFGSRAPARRRVSFADGVSERIELLPGVLAVQLAAPSGRLEGVFLFNLSVSLPPAFDILAVLERLADIDAAHSAAPVVFDRWDLYEDDLAGLQSVWDNSPEPALRLGAFLLAFAYQCERLRRGLPLPAALRASTLRRVT